jgi:hypothetical protein
VLELALVASSWARSASTRLAKSAFESEEALADAAPAGPASCWKVVWMRCRVTIESMLMT